MCLHTCCSLIAALRPAMAVYSTFLYKHGRKARMLRYTTNSFSNWIEMTDKTKQPTESLSNQVVFIAFWIQSIHLRFVHSSSISRQQMHSFSCCPGLPVKAKITAAPSRISPSWAFPFGCFLFLRSWTFSHWIERIWFKFCHKLTCINDEESGVLCWDLTITEDFSENQLLACAQWRHNMAADIPFLEVTGRKSKQNGGRSNWKK